jgi:hypothetical protein
MAGEDQQRNIKAHVGMSPLPDFFTNTPATWFQQVEAAARPKILSAPR